MPEETPAVKVRATRDHGANVVLCGAGQRESVAAELVERDRRRAGARRSTIPDVIAGQGTIGLEIAHDLADVASVVDPDQRRRSGPRVWVPRFVRMCPQAEIFGVEPELAADTAESLAAGHRVEWPVAQRNRTIADGLRSTPSALTFAHLQRVLDDVITVTEDEIRSAARQLAHPFPPGR